MKNLIKLISSFFYLGYAPVASGTVGSLAGLAIYFLCRNSFGLYTIVLIVIAGLGFLVCSSAEKIFNEKDSPKIVIDEIAGMLLAFWALGKLNLSLVVAGFLCFRFFDIVKIYPANRLERLKGSLGIMGDDLIAAIYTNIALQIVTKGLMRWM